MINKGKEQLFPPGKALHAEHDAVPMATPVWGGVQLPGKADVVAPSVRDDVARAGCHPPCSFKGWVVFITPLKG